MPSVNACLLIATKMAKRDSDYVLERLDAHKAAGMGPQQAQRQAAADLVARVDQERRATEQAIRRQHADLFEGPRLSRAAPPAGPTAGGLPPARPAPRYTLREFGLAGLTIEAIQDRYNRWKHAIDDVQAQGGILTEANDFYRAEERYWGKVASRIEDFEGDLQQFIKAVAADKLTLADMQDYAYAMHAMERNEYLRGKRQDGGGGFDSWSGMSDDDAQAIIDTAIQSGQRDALERHRQTLQGWIQGTRDLMLNEGLITPEEHQTLSTFYKDYVPLRGNPNATQGNKGNGSGKGFNIRGKETKKAKGRYSEADHIIEHVIADRTRALMRAGKNEVLRTFLQFVLDNPSDNLWQVDAVESKPVMSTDANGDQIITEEPAVVKDDRTIGIKDGGREVYVKINDAKLREQMQNLHVEQLNKWLGYLAATQRLLGRMYTSLNPVFTVLNWFRDVLTGTVGMVDEVGFKGAAKLWLTIPRAMNEARKAEFGQPSADYQLFRSTGGKTGFFGFQDVDTLAADLQKQLKQAELSGADPRVWAPAALGLVEKLNAMVENSTRLAAWIAARDEGKTLAQASSISKNITVNFNRKGTATPTLGAFFLFFNPAVQGTARIAQSLQDPKVMAALGAGMAGVALLALQNASMGDDDDGVAWWYKVSQDTKDRNLIIMLPPSSKAGEAIPGTREGRYIKIPMPYGYNWFATIANQAVDMWRHHLDPARGVKPVDAMGNVFKSFLKAYVPVNTLGEGVDNTKSLAMTGFPGIAQPVVQSLLNTNAFGKAMYPDDVHNQHMPDSSKYFAAQAGTVFQKGAQALNRASGGTAYTSGALDFTPATLENLVRAYGGGPASFTLDLMNAMYVRQSIQRPDLDVRRLPFIKQLYGRIDAETDRANAYQRIEKVASVVDPIEQAKRDRKPDDARAMLAEAPELYRLGGALKTIRSQLSTLRKEELSIIASDEADSVKYARLMAVDVKKRQVLQRMNAAFNDAARARATAPQ